MPNFQCHLCSKCFQRQQDLKGHYTKAHVDGQWNAVQLSDRNDIEDLEITEEEYENDVVESVCEKVIDVNRKKWSCDLQEKLEVPKEVCFVG